MDNGEKFSELPLEIQEQIKADFEKYSRTKIRAEDMIQEDLPVLPFKAAPQPRPSDFGKGPDKR